jgi:hypothetical protein
MIVNTVQKAGAGASGNSAVSRLTGWVALAA